MPTLYELKEKLAMIQAEMQTVNENIVKRAADPKTPVGDLKNEKTRLEELDVRYQAIREAHDRQEEADRAQMKRQEKADPASAKAQAKGEFYRAVMLGKDPRRELQNAYTHLGGIPAGDTDLGYGDKLLPSTMTNELIVEPVLENPMRAIVRVSNITGLEEPRLTFDLEGALDDVTDKQTAREIEMYGDSVEYGRHKVKPKASVSDTVLHGTTTNLTSEIDNALRSGLAANEMRRMFDRNPSPGYEEMSFYSARNGVKRVFGETKRAAIAAAIADLPLYFRRNAKIVMNAVDWYEMWGDNLNQSGMFYEDRPVTLFGKPVVLIDDATDPIVGDFTYCRVNYDIGTTYDADKDVDAGVYKFVLTAWYDIKLRLRSAFRIAAANSGDDPTLSALSLGALSLNPAFNPNVTDYTATTTNATNTITATASSGGASVGILVNDEEVASGSAAEWRTGTNQVVITVVSGKSSMNYFITVTKGE